MITRTFIMSLLVSSVIGTRVLQDKVQYHPSRIIVGTNAETVNTLDVNVLRSKFGVSVTKFIGNDVVLMNINDNMNLLSKIEVLKKTNQFKFVEPDYRAISLYKDGGSSFDLYGIDKISMPCVWSKITNGSANARVCVIDTGVAYSHPDIVGNIWQNPWEKNVGNGIDNDLNGYVDDVYGLNAITDKGNATDDNVHGTHVAGTIGAIKNNVGVVGVAPKINIIPCKFLSADGSGYYSDAIQCIEYCKGVFEKYRKIDSKKNSFTGIYSNSWGGYSYSSALYDSIKNLNEGATQSLFIAAAGNNAFNTDTTPMYPAAMDLDNIVSVAATDSTDTLAYFSNYGINSVDIAAPGVDIVSTGLSSTYVSLSGTSMATPFVSSVAALLAYKKVNATAAEIKNALMLGVDVLPNLQTFVKSGGRLNALKSMNILLKKSVRCQ
jgi:thermitase